MAKTVDEFKKMAQDEAQNKGKSKHYSEDSLFDKIKKNTKDAGVKVMYLVLLLYYSIPKLDLGQRAMVFFALGYFIAPFDVISDLIPVIGFADDLAALTAVGITISSRIDDDTKQKAKDWLKKQKIWGDDIEKQLETQTKKEKKNDPNNNFKDLI